MTQALQLASARQAPLLQLRAALSLGRLWRGQGRNDAAHPLGRYETGGRAALPIWLAYMTKALEGRMARFCGGIEIANAFTERVPGLELGDGAFGAAADSILLARLDLAIGDRISVGNATFQIRSVVGAEPDKLAGGVGLGPRFLVSEAGLRATELLQPGSLVIITIGTVQ